MSHKTTALLAALIFVAGLLVAPAAAADEADKPPAPRLRLSFTGSGEGRFRASEPDSSPAPRRPKKHPWLAALETFSINLGVWAGGRYVINDPASRIGWSAWKRNLRDGFAFDNDSFTMNFIGHPFQGSQCFSGARSLGMSFWEAVPYTFAGSLTWEMFGEATQPSTDDLIFTTTAGTFLGETMFRLSSQVLDDSATGAGRAAREVAAFLIDPIRGFNRLVSGRAWKTSPVNREIHKSMIGTFGAGGVVSSTQANLIHSESRYALEIQFAYGDSSWEEPSSGPFNLLVFDGHLRFGDTFNYSLLAFAPLWSGRSEDARGRKLMYGLFQNFDSLKNSEIELGGTSLTGGLITSLPLGGQYSFSLAAQAGTLVFGASNNPHTLIEHRDYNYGFGPVLKLDLVIHRPGTGCLVFRYSHYQIFTFDKASAEENESRDVLNYIRTQLNVCIWRNLGFRVRYTAFLRTTHFKAQPVFRENRYLFGASVVYAF
jgi:hypothetical protein